MCRLWTNWLKGLLLQESASLSHVCCCFKDLKDKIIPSHLGAERPAHNTDWRQ